jgi:hypothetical protein
MPTLGPGELTTITDTARRNTTGQHGTPGIERMVLAVDTFRERPKPGPVDFFSLNRFFRLTQNVTNLAL